MTNFLRFTTTDDRIIYIDTDNIVMISEHRYRLNDIGYVGSTISFHVGTAASSINVKDDPEEVYHYMRNADLVHDQEMYLPKIQGKTIRCTDPSSFEELRKTFDKHKFLEELAKEQESIKLRVQTELEKQDSSSVRSDKALVDTPAQEPRPVPSIEDFINYIDNHPINNLRVRPEPTTYRTPPQETQVFSFFLVHLFEELNRFYLDTTKKLLWIPQVDDVIVDKEGSTWLVTESNPPTIKAKAIGLHQEVAMFSLDCIAPYFSEHSFDLGVQALVGRRNKRTTPNPPQEPPPCNGNGEAQLTEG